MLDDGIVPSELANIESTDAELVALMRLDHVDAPISPSEPRRIGRFEVTVSPQRVGSINESIRVSVRGNRGSSVAIPVFGTVANEIEALPKRLVLPRSVNGLPEYGGVCLVKSQKGERFVIREVVAPLGLSVEVPTGDVVGTAVAKVALDPVSGGDLFGKTVDIHLKISVGNKDMVVAIPVTCMQDTRK